jgi:phage anti-repressor protein
MTTVREINTGKQMILANDFFKLLKTKEDFMDWMYQRITKYEMELNNDFFLFLPLDAVKELSRYETFQDARTRELIEQLETEQDD